MESRDDLGRCVNCNRMVREGERHSLNDDDQIICDQCEFQHEYNCAPADLKDISLRDHFAGLAMQGQLSGFWTSETPHGWSHKEIADEAYLVADAMIASRKRGLGPDQRP